MDGQLDPQVGQRLDELARAVSGLRESLTAAPLVETALPPPLAVAAPAVGSARLSALEAEVQKLRQRLDALPETNLLSRSMVSRAFSVWGHMLLAQLIVTIPVVILIVLAMSGSTP